MSGRSEGDNMIIMRKSGGDYRVLIGWGQAFLMVGLLAASLSDGSFLWETVGKELFGGVVSSSLRGFAAGLSIPMLGASIYLNVRGLVLYRESRG